MSKKYVIHGANESVVPFWTFTWSKITDKLNSYRDITFCIFLVVTIPLLQLKRWPF